MRGERFPPISICVLGKPKGKPGREFCQSKQRPTRSNADKVNHNLLEILKEITRIRCAQEQHMMREYIETHVRPSALTKLRPLLTEFEAGNTA